MKKLLVIAFLTAFAMFGAGEKAADADIIDTQTFSGTQCGADCFGATYTVVITDANDANPTTFTGSLTVAIGTYTGSMDFIGAVDIKPGQLTSGNLTDFSINGVSQGTGGWTTLFSNGQAAGNCLNGSGGFLCSYDTAANTLAPTSDNTTYEWDWNFTLSGAYGFGHLGVNYTVANDSCEQNVKGTKVLTNDCLQDGQNISIGEAGTDGASPTDTVPEPSTLLLLGAGLIVMARFARKSK